MIVPRTRRVLHCAAMVIGFAASTRVCLGDAPPAWSFKKISLGEFEGFTSMPAVNASGTVAFVGTIGGVRGLYKGNGKGVTNVVQPAGDFFNAIRLPAINKHGTIAFLAEADGLGRTGVYSATRAGTIHLVADPTTLVTSPDGLPRTYGGSGTNFADINDNGTVAFFGLVGGGGAIMSGQAGGNSGNSVSALVNNYEVGTAYSSVTGIPSQTNAGQLYFAGQRSAAGGGGSGVIRNGAVVAPKSGSGSLSASNKGVVWQNGNFDAGTSIGMYSSAGAQLFADTNAAYSAFGSNFASSPSIGDSGRVGFIASLDAGGHGLFTGPNALTDKVIQTGDLLFGTPLDSVDIGQRGVSPSGQIAFRYSTADGAGVAIATPLYPLAGEVGYGVGGPFHPDVGTSFEVIDTASLRLVLDFATSARTQFGNIGITGQDLERQISLQVRSAVESTGSVELINTYAQLVEGGIFVSGEGNTMFMTNSTLEVTAGGTVEIAAGASLMASNTAISVSGIGSTLALTSAEMVASGGLNLTANNGGKLIATDGASLIATDGASLIATDGASLIATDGASLIATDGASLIATDGASLIGMDGGSLVANAGSISAGTSGLSGGRSGSADGTLLRSSIAGNGTFTAPAIELFADADLRPGDRVDVDNPTLSLIRTVGTMTLDGDLVLSAGARLLIDLSVGGGDKAIVTGSATLAGTLDVAILGALDPAYLTYYDVMEAAELIGRFDAFTGREINPQKYLVPVYSPTQVRLAVALPGDANINGMVGFEDLVVLAQNYNIPSSAIWQTGDFSGNGAVGFEDLVSLAQNYNQSVLTGEQLTLLGGDFAADWALAQSLVPEPITFAALLPACGWLMRRRRSAAMRV